MDDDTKPPPPTEAVPIDSIVGGGNDPREMALNCKIVGLKHKVKALTKENEDLKREIEEIKKSAPTESASPSKKNIKGDRKIVKALYYGLEYYFQLPDGLDLNDKTKVEEWYVRYGTLNIVYADDEADDEEIEMRWEIEPDHKHAKEVTIEDADECPFPCYSDDDEEDDDEDDGA